MLKKNNIYDVIGLPLCKFDMLIFRTFARKVKNKNKTILQAHPRASVFL